MRQGEFEIAVALAKKGVTDAVALFGEGLSFKGAVDYYGDLPNDAQTGDVYVVRYQGDSGTAQLNARYAWGDVDGTDAWIYVGGGMYFDGEYIVY